MGDSAIGPTVRRLKLGKILREAREKSGFTQEQVLEPLDYSIGSLKRVESGRGGVKVHMLRAMMDLYNITDPDRRSQLEQLAREGRVRGWWSAQRSELRDGYVTYIGLEDDAYRIREFQGRTIPGLLQTEDYTRAMARVAIPAMRPKTIESRVAVRMQRQQILRRPEPPKLHVILDEGAVRRRVGSRDVWRAQLRHLIEVSEDFNVEIQVLPFELGAYASALGGFVELSLPEFPPLVYIELDSSDLLLEGVDAQGYTLLFENLRTQALAPSLSVALIEAVANEGS